MPWPPTVFFYADYGKPVVAQDGQQITQRRRLPGFGSYLHRYCVVRTVFVREALAYFHDVIAVLIKKIKNRCKGKLDCHALPPHNLALGNLRFISEVEINPSAYIVLLIRAAPGPGHTG